MSGFTHLQICLLTQFKPEIDKIKRQSLTNKLP